MLLPCVPAGGSSRQISVGVINLPGRVLKWNEGTTTFQHIYGCCYCRNSLESVQNEEDVVLMQRLKHGSFRLDINLLSH